jgi:hypothetical protein
MIAAKSTTTTTTTAVQARRLRRRLMLVAVQYLLPVLVFGSLGGFGVRPWWMGWPGSVCHGSWPAPARPPVR